MLTVSCYAFHPLIQRFVRLWRYVQVVSDVITFGLSMLCCQCSDAMPLSSSASVETKPSIQVFEGYRRFPTEVESCPGRTSEPRKPEHMVIDVTPGTADMPTTQERHQEYRLHKSRTASDAMMVEPQREAGPSKRQLIDLSRDPVRPVIVVEQSNGSIPGIHAARKHNKTGCLKDALQTGACLCSWLSID
ncbi:hypothetical protein PYW07_017456 [Mythimna separata]|uniref:Uncharacterized protein n=1 Tax=Mythimna separata TaxID=271217 RepID=A0AAD7YX92_MYTSE|nr:hypothetical protein PYW07_017456 [Mythimna separata]